MRAGFERVKGRLEVRIANREVQRMRLGRNVQRLAVEGNLHVDQIVADEKMDRTTARAEVQQLRKENARLLMERDILKKAAAFFAKEQP